VISECKRTLTTAFLPISVQVLITHLDIGNVYVWCPSGQSDIVLQTNTTIGIRNLYLILTVKAPTHEKGSRGFHKRPHACNEQKAHEHEASPQRGKSGE
jgi:hypothetical protein